MSEFTDHGMRQLERRADFLAGFAAGAMMAHGCYYGDGPGWGSVAALLEDERDIANQLLERWLEGSVEFGPLIEGHHQRLLDEGRAANQARDAARAAERRES